MSAESNRSLGVASEEQLCPWPMKINGSGEINGEEFTVQGSGVIPTQGVYEATLDFGQLPEGFHPSPITVLTVSTSCYAQAATRHDTPNMSERGTEKYTSTRRLTTDDTEITIDATARYTKQRLETDVEITGEFNLPTDLSGHSSYFVRVDPTDDGRLVGAGEATFFRADGQREVEMELDSEYRDIEPDPLPVPVTEPMYRIVTEDGNLHGTTYETKIHSLVEGMDPIGEIDDMESDFL